MVAIDILEMPNGKKEETGSSLQTVVAIESKLDNSVDVCVRTGGSENCGEEGEANDSKNMTQNGVRSRGKAKNGAPGNVHKKRKVARPKEKVTVFSFFSRKNPWTREQMITLWILAAVEFLAAAVVSIQAPFYPNVARSKGATATESGLVFGVFEITVFIMSPMYGAYMNKLKPRRVFNLGILCTGICCIIFGLLDHIEGRVTFIAMSLLIRIVEATGDAAFDTASFTIIAMEFPTTVATSFSMLEIAYGLGLIVGPSLGTGLYQLGGYPLPFFTMGGLLFLAAITTYYFLPESSKKDEEERDDTPDIQATNATPHGGFQMFRLLKIPVIAMVAYSIVVATAGIGFMTANLDYHMGHIGLSSSVRGLVFVLNGAAYALTAPVWGCICDRVESQKIVTFAGAVISILGFMFIGPVPYFPIEKSLLLTCLGLLLCGLGLAASLVSSFLQFLDDANDNGYPNDIHTYGLVSGLWTSMSALGYSIGPSVGGVLVDKYGFRWASLFIVGGQFIMVLMLTIYYLAVGRNAPKRERKEEEDDEEYDETELEEVVSSPGSVQIV